MRLLSSVLFITSALLSGASVAGAATHRWDASSGLLPTQIAVPWTAIDTAAADPSLAGGVLTLATVSSAENMGYRLDPPRLSIPATTILELRGRLVSSTSSDASRTAMMVQINPAPFVVVQLGIGVGQIFLNAGDLERGPVANVATTDAMHTYRLELSGTTAGSAVKVYYDGVLTLTGSAYGNPSALGSPVILWGEISTIARGTSEWEFVEQNAVPAPVPTATPWITLPAVAILCVTGLRALGRRARALDAEEREARARSSVTSQTGCAELRRSGVAVDGMESADGPQTVR